VLERGRVRIGADAFGARDAKASNDTTDPAVADPRVLLMVTEAYRHAKPIAAVAVFWKMRTMTVAPRRPRPTHSRPVIAPVR